MGGCARLLPLLANKNDFLTDEQNRQLMSDKLLFLMVPMSAQPGLHSILAGREARGTTGQAAQADE